VNGGANVVVRLPDKIGVRNHEAADRTTRYNDTGVPSQHKISSNGLDLSRKWAISASCSELVHKKYA
jgi:hypothetical protein